MGKTQKTETVRILELAGLGSVGFTPPEKLENPVIPTDIEEAVLEEGAAAKNSWTKKDVTDIKAVLEDMK